MSDEKDFDVTPDASDVQDNDSTKPAEKAKPSGKGPFWTAMAILIILMLLSFVLLGIKLAEYAKIDEREVLLKSNMDAEMDIFSVTYKNETGNIIIEGSDGEKVIAPGSAVDYSVRLRNKDTMALDYTLIVQVDTINEDNIPGVEIPVVFRLLDPHGDYLAGDPKTWAHSLEMDGVSHNDTIKRGESYEYLFQWKWPFEGGNDELDTYLGELAASGADIGLKVTFTLRAEVNTSLAANGGFWGSGLGTGILFVLIVLLLLTAIVLLIIHFYKKIKAERAQLNGPDTDPNGTGAGGADSDDIDEEFKIRDDDEDGTPEARPVVTPVGQPKSKNTAKTEPKSGSGDKSSDTSKDNVADDSDSEPEKKSKSKSKPKSGPIPVGVPVSGSAKGEADYEDEDEDDYEDEEDYEEEESGSKSKKSKSKSKSKHKRKRKPKVAPVFVPEVDAVPEVDDLPHADDVPEVDTTPAGDTIPEGEAVPEGEAAPETENVSETEPATESETESAAPSDEQTQE